jgi:hypothetical protein
MLGETSAGVIYERNVFGPNIRRIELLCWDFAATPRLLP